MNQTLLNDRFKTRPIGVFDSGVGGLTALTRLAGLLPEENFLYLGDTARVPYGSRSIKTIQRYARQCTAFLHERQVKYILVACNTVSAVAMSEIQSLSSVPVIGVIKPAAAAAVKIAQGERIGIIGTHATIKSESYVYEIHQLAKHKVEIFSQACPLFVPLIEEGWHQHKAAYAVAREYLAPLKKARIDTLILGCTHYPLLKQVIHDIIPHVQLIDSGEEAAFVAAEAIKNLSKFEDSVQALIQRECRSIECYMTDMTEVSLRFASQLLGVSSEAVHQISIDG